MKIDIIKVGNSKGIRIPKAMLEACGIGDSVELEVKNGKLLLSPVKDVRAGWEEAFKQMAADGDDELLLPDEMSPSPEEIEWKW